MRKGKYEQNAAVYFRWIWIILALVLIVLLVFVAMKECKKIPVSNQQDTTGSINPTVEKNPDSIAIPGYEILELKADSKEQTLCMLNPAQNCCYFRIALYMEDGVLLWESELIMPGENSDPIFLSKELEKGMYPNAILRYSCYRMDDTLAPLNGAETKLTLWVK